MRAFEFAGHIITIGPGYAFYVTWEFDKNNSDSVIWFVALVRLNDPTYTHLRRELHATEALAKERLHEIYTWKLS